MRKTSYNGSQGQKLANRTMTVSSNFKFQNLERLNTIVGEVSERNNKQTIMRSGKIGMSDKVLDLIKNRIKTNYDKLYQNYDQNKKTILKQIQQVQTNMSSQNAISKGFENVIKEKSHYDKAKSELESKQKKLKKLMEVRDQLKGGSNQNRQLTDVLGQKFNLFQNLESYRQVLDYQTAVLNNMKGDRRNIKLFLKERYDRMLADEQFKKQRIKKLENINHTKRANLKRIQQTLRKEEHCEIPQNLAEELQRKLEEYQGKHTYENIIKHENILSQQLRKKYDAQEARQKQETRKQRLLKEKEDLKEYELAYNFYLIKQQEEQKIKKICGVSSLSEIVNNNLQSDFQNLEQIKKQIQSSIQRMKKQNQNIKQDISSILTGKQQFDEQNLLKTQQQYVIAQKQLKAAQANSLKKYELLNEWQALIQMMTKRQFPRQKLGELLKEVLDQIVSEKQGKSKKRFSLQNLQSSNYNKQINNKFKKLKEQYESQCSILDGNLV